jgi:hypothetical protein
MFVSVQVGQRPWRSRSLKKSCCQEHLYSRSSASDFDNETLSEQVIILTCKPASLSWQLGLTAKFKTLDAI